MPLSAFHTKHHKSVPLSHLISPTTMKFYSESCLTHYLLLVFLHPLKTSETFGFLLFLGGVERKVASNGLNTTQNKISWVWGASDG